MNEGGVGNVVEEEEEDDEEEEEEDEEEVGGLAVGLFEMRPALRCFW